MHHYAVRVKTVSFLIMLTINRIISVLFNLDFQRMTALSEKYVMVCVSAVTSICTLACILQEAVVINIRGLDHFSRLDLFIWLGKVVWIQKTTFKLLIIGQLWGPTKKYIWHWTHFVFSTLLFIDFLPGMFFHEIRLATDIDCKIPAKYHSKCCKWQY